MEQAAVKFRDFLSWFTQLVSVNQHNIFNLLEMILYSLFVFQG